MTINVDLKDGDLAEYLARNLSDLEFELLVRKRIELSYGDAIASETIKGVEFCTSHARVELTYNWEDKATWSVGVGTSYRDSLRLNGEVLHTTFTDCVEMWKRQHGNKLSLLLPAPVKSGFED